MQALVTTIIFWKESSFSKCEAVSDQQEGSSRPGAAAVQQGGPQEHLGSLVPSVQEQ